MRLITVLVTTLVFTTLALSAASALTCQRSDFDAFKTQYGKTYATAAEDARRFSVFCANLQRYEQLNQLGGATYGATKFSDLTQEEFRAQYLGYRPSSADDSLLEETSRPVPAFEATPKTFDWRTHKGILTPVYNQGQCGSCWAFSATENIESQWALAGNKLTELSMQQIVDCDTEEGGCNGGDPRAAYAYIIKKGQEAYKDYPYTGSAGSCRYQKGDVVATIEGWEYAGTKNEKKMASFLAAQGPISIVVDAANWDGYQGGIVKASQCGNKLDHCVLAVGYDLNKKYWIVRNSWGTDWGVQNGFIYLQYGANTCGISDYPTCSKVKNATVTD